jgi:FkbM family methyltransferase
MAEKTHMATPDRAKLIGGVWLPEEETHLVDIMLNNPRGTVLRDGKATYQFHKIDACVTRLPPTRRRVCIDVGGHVGLWSMWLARAFGQVHAFEPAARHADLFRHNVPDGNVTLHEVALGEEPGVCEVRWHGESSGDAFIEPGVGDVEVRTLDSFGFTKVDFIKIDVEGFELQVVAGGRETLMRNRPMVCVEQKGREARNFGADPKGALDFLLGLGMRELVEIHGDHILDWPE